MSVSILAEAASHNEMTMAVAVVVHALALPYSRLPVALLDEAAWRRATPIARLPMLASWLTGECFAEIERRE